MKPSMRAFERFAKITLHRYERYLPTAFDESLTLLEKMNKLIEYLNAMGVQLGDVVDQWNEVMEWIISDGINDTVLSRLDEMIDDGTLATIINEHIFEELNTKIDGIDDRLENVETHLEERELLREVDITDYAHLVGEDGIWHNAIMTALNEAKQVTFPVGHYKTYPIESQLSDRAIVGRGDGTTFEFVRETPTGVVNGFRLEGEIAGNIIRVTQSNVDNDNVLYLENTSTLNVGDKIRVTSQRNSLSYEDSGNDWLLGRPTNTQRVPFGEYAFISEVHNDHIVLETSLIYPHYMSSNVDEVNPAHDFSFVEKINFVSNWLFKDFKVVDMVSGHVVRVGLGYNVIVDGVNFDDSNYGYGSTGIFFGTSCLNCEVRHSSHYLKSNNNPNEMYWTNSLKLTGSQNCGFNNCKTEHAGQSVDLTFFDLDISNTNNYIENCKFINSKASSMTTHGGDYGTKITNNQFVNCTQGVAIRGRGGVISGNVFQGTSRKNYNSYLSAGVSLYQGGACDTLITGNTFKNYNTGIIQSDSGLLNGRIGYAGNTISNNIIIDCNIGVHVYKLYTGETTFKDDYMGLLIVDNQIRIKHHSDPTGYGYGVLIGRAVRGVTVRGNMIKAVKGEPPYGNYGVQCEEDAQDIRVLYNTFMNFNYGIGHKGYSNQPRYENLKMNREGNEFIGLSYNARILGGVRPYSNDEVDPRIPWGD